MVPHVQISTSYKARLLWDHLKVCSTFPFYKTASEKAEKPNKKKKPEVKKADASGKVKKSDPKAKKSKKRKPPLQPKPGPSPRNQPIQLVCWVFRKAMYKRKYSATKSRIEKEVSCPITKPGGGDKNGGNRW
ncbi:60S ribosomal protein L6 [Tupaia chinensis]|uniref:60S ribosomal protein L6 n=1 Tax=Tupaia chinensis TaxID=246437 RepID=L9K376_TUPCH|nr:60S ribosomal protein L6 [Tupaia chinensis]